MENTRKEELINKLLVIMNEDIEEQGNPIKNIVFNLSDSGEDMKNFIEKESINLDDAKAIVKICISRGFLKRRYSYGEDAIFLTEDGQGRAISFINSDKKYIENMTGISIGELNIQSNDGQVQVGHGNIQMLEISFKELIQKINTSDAPEEKKKEAKNKLKEFLSHPLTSTIIGASVQTLLTFLG